MVVKRSGLRDQDPFFQTLAIHYANKVLTFNKN